IRVLTKGSHHEFLVSTPVGPVTAPPAPPQAIAPQHGVQLIGVPVGGTVTYKAPGQSAFAPLDTTKPIPVDSLIDARGGRVRLTAATGVLGDRTPDQSIEFYGGLFKIQQSAATNSVAIARLVGKLSCGSAASGKASASGPQAISAKRRGKRLWGSGSGSYATAGRGGTGSVRGTTWLTKETCQGTFFKVADEPGPHGIDVNAKGKKKPVFLGPGDSYLAER
ncbi:MAG: hypothetical protein M3M99_01965, partial [Actinomycetota bacterium]|nr:hypothetical protein [Actinomycetota bacterium]